MDASPQQVWRPFLFETCIGASVAAVMKSFATDEDVPQVLGRTEERGMKALLSNGAD
jgi:hypothetical protein